MIKLIKEGLYTSKEFRDKMKEYDDIMFEFLLEGYKQGLNNEEDIERYERELDFDLWRYIMEDIEYRLYDEYPYFNEYDFGPDFGETLKKSDSICLLNKYMKEVIIPYEDKVIIKDLTVFDTYDGSETINIEIPQTIGIDLKKEANRTWAIVGDEIANIIDDETLKIVKNFKTKKQDE